MEAIILMVLAALGLAENVQSASPTTAAPATIACPGPVNYVQLEEGNRKPFPQNVHPDWENNEPAPNIYAEWTSIANRPITVHCHLDPSKTTVAKGKEVVDIKIPAGLNKCVLFRGEFSCFIAPPKSDRAKPTASPSPAK